MIFLILILGFILRIVSIGQSLWLDEAINVVAAKELTLLEYLFIYPIGDFHPPGYFFILWIFTHTFGFSEFAVRLPSIAFAILTIYLTYRIAKDLFNKKVALLASFLLSIAPLHIYYSQEARMYSFASFAVTLSFYFFLKFLNNSNQFFIGLIGSSVLVLYSDYVSYFIFPGQLIYLLIYKRQKALNYCINILIALFLAIPIIPLLIEQLKVGMQTSLLLQNWSFVVGGASLKNVLLLFIKIVLGRVSFENNLVYGVVLLICIVVYALIFWKVKHILKGQNKSLFYWLIIPPISALVISFIVPVFAYFRFLFILPAFYILTAANLYKKRLRKLLTILVVFISFTSILAYYINPSFQREDWKSVSRFINSLNSKTDLVLLENNSNFAPLKYYGTDLKVLPGLKKVPAKELTDVIDPGFFENKSKIYKLDYLKDITDSEGFLEQKLLINGFKKSNTIDFSGVGFIHSYTTAL